MYRNRFIAGVVVACLASLLFVACSAWHRANVEANEAALSNRLDIFRTGIRKYAAERNELPQSLAALRAAGYGEASTDPITGRDDWEVIIGEDPQIIKGKRGVINIHSSSKAISSRGTPYNTW